MDERDCLISGHDSRIDKTVGHKPRVVAVLPAQVQLVADGCVAVGTGKGGLLLFFFRLRALHQPQVGQLDLDVPGAGLYIGVRWVQPRDRPLYAAQ